MMKVLVFLALISICSALVLPPSKIARPDGDGPDCGAKKSLKSLKTLIRPIHKEATFLCEMCLDLVQIAEMYAECDEAYADKKMDEKCDSYFHSGVLDKVCRDMIDDVMAELEKDTEKDPSKVCTKITKKDCHYSF